MEKFDIGKFLAESGVKLDTEKREKIEYISVDLIVPDPNNFYTLSGIEDLAENISFLGLQQPIRVRPMPGDDSQVIIVSGHRRFAAIKMLIEQDHRDDLRDVPCIVETPAENPALTQLRLIYANASTRVLSSPELASQAEQVEKLLYQLKEDGVEFPGRMRDHVAQACKVSAGKLARLKVIRDGLADVWQKSWKSGVLKESAAYELARLYPAWQGAIWDHYTKGGKQKLPRVYACDITTWAERFRSMEELTCKKTGGPCENICKKQKQAMSLPTYFGTVPCGKCCAKCTSLGSCKNACAKLKDQIKAIKAEKAEERANADAKRAEADRPEIEYIKGVYSRVGSARKASGVSVEELFDAVSAYYSQDGESNQIDMENGSAKFDKYTRLPFGNCFYASYANSLCAAADLLGVSIDYLLGRSAQPEQQDQTPSPAPSAWQTGTPPVPGWYICRIKVDGVDDPLYHKHWFGGKSWQGLVDDIETVTHWTATLEDA